jgi:hypothetical protein
VLLSTIAFGPRLPLWQANDGAGGDGGGSAGSGSDDGGAGGSGSDGAGNGDDDGGKDDAAALKRTLDKVRQEKKDAESARKAAEKSLREMQERLDALEGKDKSEAERLATERDRLKADLDAARGEVETVNGRLRRQAIDLALTNAATKAGARYPDLLVGQLADRAEVDDELNVANADALVADARKRYPDLFRAAEGKADGGKRDEDTRGADVKPGFARLRAGYETDSKTAKRAR